jgi:hypothetical protein
MEMIYFIPVDKKPFVLLAAQADLTPVLIEGESGTGKTAIANWIHIHGTRKNSIFTKATQIEPLHQQILKSEGGTLLIPEIGEWPLSEQKNLLEFLRTQKVPDPNSEKKQILANVRILTTTSQCLSSRAQGGLFNDELLKKISLFHIKIPLLIERKKEFNTIALEIMKELSFKLNKKRPPSLSQEAQEKLEAYTWPGNLRELRNVIRYALTKMKGQEIRASNLPNLNCLNIDFQSTKEQFEKIYFLKKEKKS